MKIDPKLRYAMFVESPEKAKSITKIFRDAGIKNIFVMATIGHFTKIADGSGYHNTGIFPDQNFKINYIVDPSKKDIVAKLKEQVKLSDYVLLASDPDREGEAIAWSCLEFLKIPKNKYKRITYQAINKKAILEAIENARDINTDLVDAAHARGALDKGFGYRMSSLIRDNGKGRSAGRCQSAALRMIVDREKEILNFVPEKYFDLYLHFFKNEVEFKAKYIGTDKQPIKRLSTQEQIDNIYTECKGNPFIVKSIEYKDHLENPKPPFSTATFQQECAAKLGLTIKQSADCAQKLFDAGKISYHRTDSEAFEEEFENILLKYVSNNFSKQYVSGKVVKGKKDENSQEGHEALHVLDLSLTPDDFAEESPNELLTKVYKIIYTRTIATALKPAIISQTTYNIYNKEHKFILNSNELKFDGYRRIYSYKDENDEKNEIIKETFKEQEVLQKCSFESSAKETQPPSRYKEASFVSELKKVGVGRPSTYATIIETIKSESRGYCTLDNKCLKPTQLGMDNIEFLVTNFGDLVNVEYTKSMEDSLDLITQGKLNYITFLTDFYTHMEDSVKKVAPTERMCPKCGKPMKIRKGPYGSF